MGLIIICLFLCMKRSMSLIAQTTFDPTSLSGGAPFHLFFNSVIEPNNRFLLPIERLQPPQQPPSLSPTQKRKVPSMLPSI